MYCPTASGTGDLMVNSTDCPKVESLVVCPDLPQPEAGTLVAFCLVLVEEVSLVSLETPSVSAPHIAIPLIVLVEVVGGTKSLMKLIALGVAKVAAQNLHYLTFLVA
jgi:hypothetical protein